MAVQLLIYESAVPVTATRHGNWSLEIANDFGFSRRVNSVPLMAVEFPHAASEYAIEFSGTKEAVIPAAQLTSEQLRALEDHFMRRLTARIKTDLERGA